MDSVTLLPATVSGQYVDDSRVRDTRWGHSSYSWRALNNHEVGVLQSLGNSCAHWDHILVRGEFNPYLIRNCHFEGMVRIGPLCSAFVEREGLRLPVGLSNSRIFSCDIGEECAIHDVKYLSRYLIGNRCILFGIDEMVTTERPRFGSGAVGVGESPDSRTWIDVMNEAGVRRIAGFEEMLPADAYLWARYRDDQLLLTRLTAFTDATVDTTIGYGVVQSQTVVKSCRTLRDVKIGSHALLTTCNSLINVSVLSSAEEPTFIGEGVELTDGIVGHGSRIIFGAKACRFVVGRRVQLKYGVRLIDTVVGDNSTISCCEVLNSLIFPAHEQHHNNSFLIAGLLMGQSNIAAGATLGSNHNSRSNDNEVMAGRGFWPGLCTSIKHSSRFASFVLLSKGDYPFEINMPLPFSLVNNNSHNDRLEIMPAFWWLHNMYALARNSVKFRSRDKRKDKVQHIEFEALAPDTIEECFTARRLLEMWTAKSDRNTGPDNPSALTAHGRRLLKSGNMPGEVYGEGIENSRRPVLVLKPGQAYHAYEQMILYYSVRTLLAWIREHDNCSPDTLIHIASGPREVTWANLGGHLVPEGAVSQLRQDIKSGHIGSWSEVHKRYDNLWAEYDRMKMHHAYRSLCDLRGVENISETLWQSVLDEAIEIQTYIRDQVLASRRKDHENPFRRSTYRDEAEMIATVGSLEDNQFIQQVIRETDAFCRHVATMRAR